MHKEAFVEGAKYILLSVYIEVLLTVLNYAGIRYLYIDTCL